MSEILVHAFGDRICEIHVSKLKEHSEAAYVATAFVHDGVDRKRRISDSEGLPFQIAEPTRRGAISRMVDYLTSRFGPFNPLQRALDLRRRLVDESHEPASLVH